MADDDLKAFEEREERKWSNLERIQQRMAARQKVRKPPRQTEFVKKKKLKNIENPEWKAKFEQDRLDKEKAIAAKYKEDQKRKRKLQKEKEAKEKRLLEKKWKKEAKQNKSGLKEKPPDTKQWSRNLAKQQAAMQASIEAKYALKKQQDNKDREVFKKKAAVIEQKYDDKKPKKKKRDPTKRAVVIDAEHNAWTAIEKNDFQLLDRIYTFFPNDLKKKDKLGNTILHHAIRHFEKRRNNNTSLIEYVIPKLPATFMNAANNFGDTPLTVAVYGRKMECVQALYSGPLKWRPNADHINIKGRTVLMNAAMRDDVEMLEMLLKVHPAPTIDLTADKNDKSALTYAVEHGQKAAAKLLIEHGANFYIRNKFGKCARDMVMDSQLMRIILKQERVNVIKGMVMSSIVRNLDVPDYLMTIIAIYLTTVPQELLDQEEKERDAAKKKKKKGARGNRRGRRQR